MGFACNALEPSALAAGDSAVVCLLRAVTGG